MRWPILALALLLIPATAWSGPEAPVSVHGAELAIVSRPPGLEYPVLAVLGRVQGTVLVRVLIDPRGEVEAAEAVEGPPSLRRTAEDFVARFRFRPVLQRGVPTRALSEFSVPFNLGPEERLLPSRPMTGFILHVPSKLWSGAAKADLDFLQQEVRTGLEKRGLAPAEPAKADPATTMDLTLNLETSKLEGGVLGQAIKVKACRLEELNFALTGKDRFTKPREFIVAAAQSKTAKPRLALEHLTDRVLEMLQPERKFTPDLASPLQGLVPVPPGDRIVDFAFRQLRVRRAPPLPHYPVGASIWRVHGAVVVEVIVDETGLPLCAAVVSGPPDLHETTLLYALGWTFEPPLWHGQPQMVRFRLIMDFSLR